MHVLFYTLPEDGRKFPKRLLIKHHWTQASWIHDTSFWGRLGRSKSRKRDLQSNQHSFHEFLNYHNDYRVSCMFYSTLCLKIDTYFNDIFEFYTAKHKPLWFTIPHVVADSTWSNRIVGLDTCILYDERSLSKGNKLNIPWLLVCIGEGRKAWTINWHVSQSHSKNGGRLKSHWHEDLFQSKSHPSHVCLVDYYG